MKTATVRRWRAVALGVACVVVGAGLAAPASADSRPADPANPATPTTVTADALPTVQISGGTVNNRPGGVVWSQAVVGSTVYVGGDFTKARPAGSPAGKDEVTRTYLLAYDITTGQLVGSFNHTLNGQVRSVVASPDGKRVYVAGDFTQVDGQWRVFVAAFNTADGSLVPGFRPTLSSAGLSLAVTNTTVYAGGNFNRAASVTGGTLTPRGYLAAFDAADGTLLPFQADANGPVTALAATADGSRLAVGGRFSTLSGANVQGLGSVDPSSGALQSFGINDSIKIYDGRTATISQLVADGDSIFGSALSHNVATGTSEGVFRVDARTGEMVWNADCHGDTYSVFPMGDAVYQAGHAHDCARIGAFGNVGFYRGIAFSRATTGKVLSIPADAPYTDHGGEPAPSLLTWFPDFPAGTYTGANQGPWSVVGNGTYLSYGGEFTQVNGQAQQSLVRFGTAAVAPNKSGPRLSGAAWGTPDVTSSGGAVTATIATNNDNDNADLTYRLYRASDANPVAQTVQTSPWYKPGTVTLDEAQVPVGTQTYWVTASDPFGNTVSSPKVQVTVVAPVPGQVAVDAFGRTVSDGWGRAGTGGAWQPESLASMFSVDGGRGVLTVDRASWTARARLSQVSVSDVDMSATMGITKRPATGWTRLTVSARLSQDFAQGYLLRANVAPEGRVDSIQLMKGRDTLIAAAWPNPLVTLGPDDRLNMRLRVVGSSLQGKVWKAGTVEPTVWALQATDTSVPGPGSVGVGALTDTTSAPLPVVVTVDDVSATAVTPPPEQVAVDAFGRTVTGGWGQAGTGGAWQPESLASMFSVDGGRGVLTVDRASWTARARLSQVSVSDVDMSATMAITRRPTTGWTRLTVSARVSQDFATGYLLRANVTPEGKVDSIQLMKGRDTLIAAAWPNPLVTLGPDDQLNMRLRVVGSTLQGKVWKAGTAEPTVWALQATDTSVTGPGSVGVGVLTDTTSAPLPVVVTVDDVTATAVR